MNRLFKTIITRIVKAFGIDISNTFPNVFQIKTNEEYLSKIDFPFRTALLSMYRGEPQWGIDGQFHHIDRTTKIFPQQGIWLYEFCLSIKPNSTLEIGLAYGYSTLYFLAAAAKNKTGFHTAVDPVQCSYWHGIGLSHANALAPRWGTDSTFRFIEDRSDRAAIDLTRANYKYDLIFIDGSHLFDYVLVDFHLYAQLCTIGGHIIFDDVNMNSVKTAVNFIRTNRTDFMEIRLKERNIAVFQKIGEDKRKWNDFHEF